MIQLTQRAADHVQQMLNKRGHGMGLRLATRKTGCSGFSYEVDYADQINDDDDADPSTAISGGQIVIHKK